MINLLLHNRMQNHMVFLRMRTFLAVRAWISSFPSTLDHHFRNNLISLLSSKSHYSSLQIQWEPIPLLLIHDNDVLELILERIEVMSTSLKYKWHKKMWIMKNQLEPSKIHSDEYVNFHVTCAKIQKVNRGCPSSPQPITPTNHNSSSPWRNSFRIDSIEVLNNRTCMVSSGFLHVLKSLPVFGFAKA